MELYVDCNIIFLSIPDKEKLYQHFFFTEFEFFYNFVIYYNM